MVLLPSSTTYLHQSTLLLQARPTTTRITTHYSLPRPRKVKSNKSSKSKPSDPSNGTNSTTEDSSPAATAGVPATPTAILTLKTYDPVSGVVLKYQTNRAAEVGRLMAALGKLGGVMATGKAADGFGEESNGATGAVAVGTETPKAAEGGTATPVPSAATATASTGSAPTSAVGGGKGKGKKKGKR